MGVKSVRDLLLDYVLLLNLHGTESELPQAFVEANKDNLEFVRLAENARWLKRKLLSGCPCGGEWVHTEWSLCQLASVPVGPINLAGPTVCETRLVVGPPVQRCARCGGLRVKGT